MRITCRAAYGKGGFTLEKREGDGTTPIGTFCLRRVLYRADRLERPVTGLKVSALRETDGWCDDPNCADYNTLVTLPHAGSAERLWRDDHVYDVIVVIGYNDDVPIPGKGSAIFLHVARSEYSPTEGCVAMALPDVLDFLRRAGPTDVLTLEP